MPQQLLHRYFPSSLEPPRSSGTCFLDLPVSIRRRVYILAGLARFCPIDLNLEEARRDKYHQEALSTRSVSQQTNLFPELCHYYERRILGNNLFSGDDCLNCICPPLPYQLLYVSHSISDEVSPILYSENAFRLSRSNQWGLKPLRNLNPKALASLTSLTIRLRSGALVSGHGRYRLPRNYSCSPDCNVYDLHDKPLNFNGCPDQIILAGWASLIQKISPHIQALRLRLNVVCDVADEGTALLFLRPLSQLPRLKHCAIRLRRAPSPALQSLAEKATRQIMGLSFHTAFSSSRLHLPEEILTKVLGYTDLIAPFNLEWHPGKGFVPFDCCKKCTDTLEVCCCSLYHAAFSSECICWRMPISLFLVSHRVRELATHIFYSRNNFVVLPQAGKKAYITLQKSPAQGELSQFLASMPQYA